MSGSGRRLAAAAFLAQLAACATGIPEGALRLPPEAAADREAQTRRYEGITERTLLAAGASVLQDLGFAIDASETRLGIVVASKERSAIDEREITAAYLVTLLSILALSPTEPTYANRQLLRVALVTRPVPGGTAGAGATLVRVTFQRSVFDNTDRLMRLEPVTGPELYQQFFDRLSQGVFLKVHSP
jgi:hypothetical protein